MWTYETSAEINAPTERIWALFADVAGWPRWNAGIETISLRGPFETGTRFVMKPPEMEGLTSVLADVRPGESFTDLTEVGDITVRVFHGVEPLANGMSKVTYRTQVDGPEAAEVGAVVTSDFDEVLEGLKGIAEASGG